MNVAAELSRVLIDPVGRESDKLIWPAVHGVASEIYVPAGWWDLKDAFEADGQRFQ